MLLILLRWINFYLVESFMVKAILLELQFLLHLRIGGQQSHYRLFLYKLWFRSLVIVMRWLYKLCKRLSKEVNGEPKRRGTSINRNTGLPKGSNSYGNGGLIVQNRFFLTIMEGVQV